MREATPRSGCQNPPEGRIVARRSPKSRRFRTGRSGRIRRKQVPTRWPKNNCIRATLMEDQTGRFCSGKRTKSALGFGGFWATYRCRVDLGTPRTFAAWRVLRPFDPGQLSLRQDSARSAHFPPLPPGPLEITQRPSDPESWSEAVRKQAQAPDTKFDTYPRRATGRYASFTFLFPRRPRLR